ncbi:MAG TPA: hypothetical protein VMU66_05595 [Gaiellales bacterium]|nr:hypothetical protein [Gaiellales bacterium]
MAVLAAGGGRAFARALHRLLPREDVVLLSDDAYAPYARRPPPVVVDRVGRLGTELVAGHRAKLVVLASAAACDDALAALRSRLPATPVVGIEASATRAAALSRGGLAAVVVGEGCVRGRHHARRLRGQWVGSGGLAAVTWPGLRELVDGGRAGDFDPAPRLAELAAASVDSLALACAHASAVAEPVTALAASHGIAVVDCSRVAALRVRATLLHHRALARRRRPGRLIEVSSDPARAVAGSPPFGGW